MKKLFKITALLFSIWLGLFAFTACSFSFDEDGGILIVSREPGSGSRDAIMEMLFGSNFADIRLPQASILNSTAAIHAMVSGNPQAIGYDSYGHLVGRRGIRILTLDGVECSVENVRNGTYAFSRSLVLVYKAQRMTGAVGQFRSFLESYEAQAVIHEGGYVGRVEDAVPFVPIVGLTGVIDISGSTTVNQLMQRLREKFISLQPNVAVNVAGGGSGSGRNNMRDNVSHFGMVSSPVTEAQINNMAQDGSTVNVFVIADDAIAIIVHEDNPVTNITAAQLRHLFNRNSNTTFATWAELKGYGG